MVYLYIHDGSLWGSIQDITTLLWFIHTSPGSDMSQFQYCVLPMDWLIYFTSNSGNSQEDAYNHPYRQSQIWNCFIYSSNATSASSVDAGFKLRKDFFLPANMVLNQRATLRRFLPFHLIHMASQTTCTQISTYHSCNKVLYSEVKENSACLWN